MLQGAIDAQRIMSYRIDGGKYGQSYKLRSLCALKFLLLQPCRKFPPSWWKAPLPPYSWVVAHLSLLALLLLIIHKAGIQLVVRNPKQICCFVPSRSLLRTLELNKKCHIKCTNSSPKSQIKKYSD